jgi:hypothetical protein
MISKINKRKKERNGKEREQEKRCKQKLGGRNRIGTNKLNHLQSSCLINTEVCASSFIRH